MKKNKKLVEKTVLNTFQEEIPSIYFSDKNKSEYEKFKDNAEYVYRELFNFPKEMFRDKKLLDFGGGTGEQTVYLTNWGAEITHVEMNSMAIAIAKKVFQKHGSNVDKHRFVNKSIFDFDTNKKYDIVHSRGVFSHTYNKEKAFNKLVSFLKPGGYLIFGDPNKIGGFQNMLQRIAIYTFANNWEKMIKVSPSMGPTTYLNNEIEDNPIFKAKQSEPQRRPPPVKPEVSTLKVPKRIGWGPGTRGQNVSMLQWILIYLGYMLEEDVAFAVGFFGPKTRLGLQKFQAEMEIVPNEPATYDKKTREILKKTVDEYLSSSPNKKNNRSKL